MPSVLTIYPHSLPSLPVSKYTQEEGHSSGARGLTLETGRRPGPLGVVQASPRFPAAVAPFVRDFTQLKKKKKFF